MRSRRHSSRNSSHRVDNDRSSNRGITDRRTEGRGTETGTARAGAAADRELGWVTEAADALTEVEAEGSRADTVGAEGIVAVAAGDTAEANVANALEVEVATAELVDARRSAADAAGTGRDCNGATDSAVFTLPVLSDAGNDDDDAGNDGGDPSPIRVGSREFSK